MARLGDRMKTLLDEDATKDVTFTFHDDQGRQSGCVEAHKIVLISASSVFKAMFFGPLAERGQVKIVDSSIEAFKSMLRFIYTDECDLNLAILGDVMYLSSKYDIPQLYDECREYIENNLNKKTVVQMYQVVSFLNDEELCNKCLEMMDKYAHYIINSNEIVELLDENLLLKLLVRDTFCAREIDILDAVRWWATQQVGTDSACIRKCLANILPLIRFPLMTLKEFVSIAVPSDLLPPEEVRQLLACYNLRNKQEKVDVIYSRVPRSLKIEFSVKASELPSSQETGGEMSAAVSSRNSFERAASKGLRSIKFRVHNRVFLKRVDLSNVPDRISIGTFVTVLRIFDLDLNESVARHDFILKRQNPSMARSGRYDLELTDPVELCPKICYEIQVSIEGPTRATPTDNVKVKLPGVSDAFFLFEKYSQIYDHEVQVSELQFMF